MKKMLTALLLLFCSSVMFAQTTASGWEITNKIAAGDSLWGGWDLIVDLDLDNDGNMEFIISRDPSISGFLSNRSAGQIVDYYESTGDNQFELRWTFQAPILNNAGNVYTAITMGDLDSDLMPELYFGTPLAISDSPPNPRGLYVFEFDGTNFPATPSETWNFGRPDNHEFKVSGMAAGDVDGDGEDELVVQSRGDDGDPGGGGGRTMMVVNSGGVDIGIGLGAFSIEFENSLNHTGGVVYDPRIVDFDNDGHGEIWVFTWDFFSLAIYESPSANNYALQVDLNQVFAPDDFGHRRGMRFFDVNGDGNLEFYTAGIQPDNAANGYIFYIGSTSDVASLTPGDVVKLGGKDLPADGSAVGDLDGDGLMDFLFAGRAPGNDDATQIHRMEYSGTGAPDDSASYEWSTLYESDSPFADLRNVAITDLDSDNKTEVLITRMNTLQDTVPVLVVLENTATGLSQNPGNTVIENYVLRQNYPNPFNPQTTIDFDIKTAAAVNLTVYNATGERVAELVNSQLPTGSYTATFDGKNLSSGVYFYSLRADDFVATRSMVLLK